VGSAVSHPWNRTNEDGGCSEASRGLIIPAGRPPFFLATCPETNALACGGDQAGRKPLRNCPSPGLPHVFMRDSPLPGL